jgi:hypothetical protein
MVEPRVQEFARKCLNRSRLLDPHGRRAGAASGSHRQHLLGAIGSPEADKAEVFLGQRHKRACGRRAGLVDPVGDGRTQGAREGGPCRRYLTWLHSREY